jgi:hypothetical protein
MGINERMERLTVMPKALLCCFAACSASGLRMQAGCGGNEAQCVDSEKKQRAAKPMSALLSTKYSALAPDDVTPECVPRTEHCDLVGFETIPITREDVLSRPYSVLRSVYINGRILRIASAGFTLVLL